MNTFEIVKTVRLTEKGTRQGTHPVRYQEKSKDGKVEIKTRPLNQYTVVADRRANKTQIRDAVQQLFKVKVIAVNTMNVRGKARRQRTTQAGTTPAWKKAIVTLKEGDKIVLT
jgi:large subunit ribosomal protein L23